MEKFQIELFEWSNFKTDLAIFEERQGDPRK